MSGRKTPPVMRPGVVLAALVLGAGLLDPAAACAQAIVDGSGSILGAEEAGTLTSRLARRLQSPDLRIANLHRGRAGALCGTVEIRNRMGTYTGPRGFVADLSDGFVGRLPEGPERRHPAGVAEYRDMERAAALFTANCTR